MPEEPTNPGGESPKLVENQMTETPPETFAVKVDGKEKQVSREDVIRAYEKAQGADERFREAAEIRKQAALGLEIQQLYQKLSDQTATLDEQSRWAELFEMDENDLQQTTQMSTPAASGVMDETKLPDSVKRAVQIAERMDAKSRAEDDNRSFNEWAEFSIDKNENLGKITKDLDTPQKKAVREEVLRQTRNAVIVEISQGAKFGPEMVNRAVSTVVPQLEKFGNLFRKVNAPIPGFGPTGNGLDLSGMAIGDEPPKRVAGTDENYSRNFAQRLMHKLAKGNR
jgi:hypothetical protein